jgi:hypothetical protein
MVQIHVCEPVCDGKLVAILINCHEVSINCHLQHGNPRVDKKG